MYSTLLNVKSCYNFLSSTIKNEDYFRFAKKNNLKNICLIDTNSMYNCLDFYFEAKKNNLFPIIGVELEFELYNISLICKNNNGYKNVLKIFEIYNVKNNSENCLKNIFQLEDFEIVVIPKEKDWYKRLDGDNFFVGLNKLNTKLIDENWSDKIIFFENINLLELEQLEYLRVLNSIRDNKKLKDYNETNYCHYLSDENISNYVNIEIHKENIKKIISDINENVIFESKPEMINFKIEENLSSNDYLSKICKLRLENLKSNNLIEEALFENYLQRMNLELKIISEMNFNDYFLVVHDFVIFAKSENIIVGPGRGSASGSLVAYLLNITEVDPIKYNLVFERFLNSERATMPDIDIDFQDDRRNEVIKYLSHKYEGNFALISTFQKIGLKNAIRDIAKILDINDDEINDALKNIEGSIDEISDNLFIKYPKLKLLKSNHEILFRYTNFLIGMPRQSGTHAAGVVISKHNLNIIAPLKISGDGYSQIEYSSKYLERIGLIKIDILGLRNLTILNEMMDQIKKSKNPNFSLKDISLNDAEVYRTLSNGDTNSIFQFESSGMVETLKKIKPKNLTDLASAMALFRPGPMEFINEFSKRKSAGIFKTEFGDAVDKILQETYGIIVYQEQIMKIFQVYAGFTLNEADTIRKAISKKDIDLLKSVKEKFLNKSLEKKQIVEISNKLWNYIEKFASYGFNKSHAISYSLISYYMSYIKTNYKSEFFCAVLNFSFRDEKKSSSLLRDFKNSNGKIQKPSIKYLTLKYRVVNGKIQMPLTSIRGINSFIVENFRESISKQPDVLKDQNNLMGILLLLYFKNFTFEIYENLVKAGAFDWYKFSRKNLLTYKNEIFLMLENYSKGANVNDIFLDIHDNKLIDSEVDLENYDLEVFGFTINTDLTSIMRNKYGMNSKKISDLNLNNQSVNIIGKIKNISLHKDKNNNEMAFLVFSDETADISVTVFASQFEAIKKDIALNNFYLLNVKVQNSDQGIRATLNKIVEKNLTIK